MPQVDQEKARVVIRLVYDGPAWAGKTTSLRGLAKSLGVQAFSGEEADGRTLYLDWACYVGGLFEGLPIECQIVGVPGQKVLERRRRMLLETADAVVFVADSRPSQMAENLQAFELLREVTRGASPAVAVVVQANKRDLNGAMTLDELRERLGGGSTLAMTQTVADRGEGIRETFVLAVRLALDRVRELWDTGKLVRGKPQVYNGPDLLSAMMAAEREVPARVLEAWAAAGTGPAALEIRAPPAVSEALDKAHAQQGPRPPDSSVPAGLVWPPVNGRVSLHEATRGSMTFQRTPAGDWLGQSGDWRVSAPLHGLYFDLEEGRHALISWSRWHAAVSAYLSPARAILLAEDAPGAWRLWQVVRSIPTLRDACRAVVNQNDQYAGAGLFRIVDLMLRAERSLVSRGWLVRVSLDSLGTSEVGEPLLASLASFPADLPTSGADARFDEERLIEEELGPVLRSELSLAPSRLPGVLAGVQLAGEALGRRHIADAIRKTLLGA